MKPRALVAAPLLAVALLVGCASSKPLLIKAEARAPIDASVSATSPQAREVPWARQTLRSSFTFPLTEPTATAAVRLQARQVAISDLAHQLSRLPATEPPPGETEQSNVGDFAARQPQFAAQIEAELLAAKETVRLVPEEKKGQVDVELALESLALGLLKSGGGYRKGDQLAEAIGPRGIAARRATEEAEETLLRKALETKLSTGKTVEDWLRSDPGNRPLLVETLRNRRTVVGEARPRADGAGEEFVAEYELDLTPVVESAHRQEKARKNTRRERGEFTPPAAVQTDPEAAKAKP